MNVARTWNRFWFEVVPLERLAIFRILCGFLLIYDAFLYDPRGVANLAGQLAEGTWRPIYIFELIGLGHSALDFATGLHRVQVIALVCGTLGIRTRTAWFIAATLAFLSGGLIYSVTKVRHDRVALFFASYALAFSPSGARFSLDALIARSKLAVLSSKSAFAAWPMKLTQVTIAIGYCAAGLSKLGSPDWLNGYTLQGIVLEHRGAFSGLVSDRLWLCVASSWLTVIVEAGFPLAVIWPRLVLFFVPAALVFHLGTWATMDTGPYMTLWFFLVAFVPFESVWSWLKVTGRSAFAIGATAAVALAWMTLVSTVMLRVVPISLFGGLCVGLGAMLYIARAQRKEAGGARVGPGPSSPL